MSLEMAETLPTKSGVCEVAMPLVYGCARGNKLSPCIKRPPSYKGANEQRSLLLDEVSSHAEAYMHVHSRSYPEPT